MRLRVLRGRAGRFSSNVLPAYRRNDVAMEKDLAMLVPPVTRRYQARFQASRNTVAFAENFDAARDASGHKKLHTTGSTRFRKGCRWGL